MKTADYLIIGQGIAGSVLALTLQDRGKSVLVIDEPSLSSSSRIAAGVYNPFNLKWRLNNWRANEVTPLAIEFYDEAEKKLGAKFHSRFPLLKIFPDQKEAELWLKEANKKKLFADPQLVPNEFPAIVDAPFGIGLVHGCGNVNVEIFLAAMRKKLAAENALVREKFDAALLELNDGGVVYGKRFASKMLVSCEGHLTASDPYFKFLPVQPVKGELLHVHIPGLEIRAILNRGVYLLPTGNDRFICGATFEHHQSDEQPTETAVEELMQKLRKFIRVPVEAEAHFAGVRPATPDRRPIAGRHPQFSQLAVFNGFGSKGILLSPWLAATLADHLENGIPLPAEVDISRFTQGE